MRKRFFSPVLVLSVLFYSAGIVNVSAYSPYNQTIASTASEPQNIENLLCHHKHDNALFKVLKDKFGFSEEEIKKARSSGMSAFELAKEKGITEAQLREFVYQEQCRRIDEKVKDGKISAEKAEKIKVIFKEKINSWDGSLNYKKTAEPDNKDSISLGFEEEMPSLLESILKNHLGFTDADIQNAKKSGKNAFELAAEKGISEKELRMHLVKAKYAEIEKMVNSGKMTPEMAEKMKLMFKEHIRQWDGSFEYMHFKHLHHDHKHK